MLTQSFIDEMKQRLLATKQKLAADLAGLSAHEELGGDIDSNVQEVEDDEVNQDMIARINADLEKIGKALMKINAGTYGTDDEGKKISEERLKVLPWADKAL